MGENLNILNGNILTMLAANSPTLKAALQGTCKYHDIMSTNPRPYLRNEGNGTLFCLDFDHAPSQAMRQTSECMFASILTVIRQMFRTRLSPIEVQFTHDAPANKQSLEAFFDCPIQFNSPVTSMRFTPEQLALKTPYANADFLQSVEQHANELLSKLREPGTWSEKVKRELLNSIARGIYDINTIASSLAVSTRKLQQKLKEEETNFKTILDKVREEIAIDHLQRGETTITELANLLGFSEQSAFNHAFKRWTGTSPSTYLQKK